MERLHHDFEQTADGIQLFGWQRIQQCVGLSAPLIGIRFHGCALSADFSLRDLWTISPVRHPWDHAPPRSDLRKGVARFPADDIEPLAGVQILANMDSA